MPNIKRFFTVVFATAAFWCNFASAQTLVEIQASPSSWLIQNYVGGTVDLFYTGSPCLNGQLIFPSTATQADQDRLWAMILSAKATGQQVEVYYYVSSGNCYISSYGLPD